MTLPIFMTMFGYMLVSSFTPGPGNILALNTTLKGGLKNSRFLLVGIGAGYFVVQYICTGAVLLLDAVLEGAMVYVKYIGAAYLVWLAVHIFLSKMDSQSQGGKSGFVSGFLMQLVNVKIYFYCTTLLSVYIVPNFNSWIFVLLMGLFVIFVGCLATLSWAVAGAKLQKFYFEHFKLCNTVMALFLLWCAVSMIWS